MINTVASRAWENEWGIPTADEKSRTHKEVIGKICLLLIVEKNR